MASRHPHGPARPVRWTRQSAATGAGAVSAPASAEPAHPPAPRSRRCPQARRRSQLVAPRRSCQSCAAAGACAWSAARRRPLRASQNQPARPSASHRRMLREERLHPCGRATTTTRSTRFRRTRRRLARTRPVGRGELVPVADRAVRSRTGRAIPSRPAHWRCRIQGQGGRSGCPPSRAHAPAGLHRPMQKLNRPRSAPGGRYRRVPAPTNAPPCGVPDPSRRRARASRHADDRPGLWAFRLESTMDGFSHRFHGHSHCLSGAALERATPQVAWLRRVYQAGGEVQGQAKNGVRIATGSPGARHPEGRRTRA